MSTDHQGTEVKLECSACCSPISEAFFYRCQHCNLNLDIGCAFYKSIEDKKETFRHYFHFHPLELAKTVTGTPIYRCGRGGWCYNLTDLILQSPPEIHHPSHQCFLSLRADRATDSGESYYHCKSCDFKISVELAQEYSRFEGQKQFYHFSHRHPLEYLMTEQNNEDGLNCSACWKPAACSAPTYGCIPCQYFIHQSCFDLPWEIQHFFHPCPLYLHINQTDSFCCRACDTTIQGFYFYCKWCNFSMDIECALLPTIKTKSDEVQFCSSSHHGHPLTLTEIKEDDRYFCSFCQRCCPGPAFACRTCSFFLHKSCFDLPRETQYLFHPSHPLILQAKPSEFKSVCNVCCKNLSGLTYRCELCDFEIHTVCDLLVPTVSYRGHNHLLLFLGNIDMQVICNNCDTPCPADSYVFRCIECDFNLHLLCGPLPLTIQPECHYHSFILIDSPLEDESDQFYCDICEKERDPRLPVYNCKDCLFPAEIKCVMSEVLLTLKGHCGEVVLGTPDGQITGKVISRSLEIELKPKEVQNRDKKVQETKVDKHSLTWSHTLNSLKEHEKIEREDHVHINGKVINKTLEVIELEPKEVQNSEENFQETKADKPSLTWNDMLNCFKEDEKIEMEVVLAASRRDIIVGGETSSNEPRSDSEVSLFSCSDLIFSGDENMETNGVLAAPGKEITKGTEIVSSDLREFKLSMFADKSFELFMEKLDSSTNYSSLTFWKGNEEVVNVRGSMIPQKLVPILQKLSSRYGDVSEESTLSPRAKNYFTVMLCGTMHSICKTRINEISEILLLNWWNNLKKLKLAGFKVQFVFDHLEKVARAYFGLQVEKFEAELDMKATNLSEAIEQLTRECKAVNEKRKCIALEKDKKSSIIKDCLLEASNKRWHLCGAGLL